MIYWKCRGQLSLHNELLLFGNRIVIPSHLRKEILTKIHQGHQGIQRCRLRLVTSVWWPGASKDIETLIQNCPQCCKMATPRKEPLMSSSLPAHPWETVAADLFELKGTSYLLVVDYFSRFPEVVKLTSTTSVAIIRALKAIFSLHSIPSVLRSDYGPQFVSTEMKQFAESYSFMQITSSPKYPQSNELVERMVQTVKGLLNNSTDPYMALLSYRVTPLPWCKLSPAELLNGRKVRTDIPQASHQLKPTWPYLTTFRERETESTTELQQKKQYDQQHRVKDQEPLDIDVPVGDIRT